MELPSGLATNHHNLLVSCVRLGAIVVRAFDPHPELGAVSSNNKTPPDPWRRVAAVAFLAKRWHDAVRAVRLFEFHFVRCLLNMRPPGEIINTDLDKEETQEELRLRIGQGITEIEGLDAVQGLDSVQLENILAPHRKRLIRHKPDPSQQICHLCRGPVPRRHGVGRSRLGQDGHAQPAAVPARGAGAPSARRKNPGPDHPGAHHGAHHQAPVRIQQFSQAETTAYWQEYRKHNNEFLKAHGNGGDTWPTVEERQKDVHVSVGDEFYLLDTKAASRSWSR